MYSSHYRTIDVRETISDSGFPKHTKPYTLDDIRERTHLAIRVASQKSILKEVTQLKSLTHFLVVKASNEDIASIAACDRLSHLQLYQSTATDFSPLRRLTNLQYLTMQTNSKLTSLEDVGKLRTLRGLNLENLSGVPSLEGLSDLSELKFLAFEGTLNKNLSVSTLEPLESLSTLEVLHMTAVRFEEASLRYLSGLRNLRELSLGVFFPAEDFARLAGTLSECDCKWFEPFHDSPMKCKKGHKKLMLSGKGLRDLCPKCDVEKIKKFSSEFQCWKDEGFG